MDQSRLEALLGRSLKPVEATNLDLYLEISKESLEDLLCMTVTEVGEDADYTTRTFVARDGYSSVFTGILHDVMEVKLGDSISEPDTYRMSFWDDRNMAFSNSIVFDDKLCGQQVEVTAKWGFVKYPSDLQRLWAQLFTQTSSKYVANRVSKKRVEDFQIDFVTNLTQDQQFMQDNARAISKYRMCDIGEIRHGRNL